MKKTLSLVALAVFIGAVSAKAVDAPSRIEAVKTWFKHLREGLSDSAVRGNFQRGHTTTAVAAVRGEGQTSVDPDKPEWKTSTKSEKAALKKERAELSAAVDLVISGQLAEGKAALDAFEKAHPKSKLLPDVVKARENIAALEASQ